MTMYFFFKKIDKVKFPFRFELRSKYLSPLKEGSFNFIQPDLHCFFLSHFTFSVHILWDYGQGSKPDKNEKERGQGLSG